MRRSEQDAALQALYEQVPDVRCKGRCWDTCGPIEVAPRERQRIRDAGVKMPHWDDAKEENRRTGGQTMCPALTADHKCGVYEVRPMICRVWGASKALPCPYGCAEEAGAAVLSAAETAELIGKSMAVGSPDAQADVALQQARIEKLRSSPMVRRAMEEAGRRYDPAETELRRRGQIGRPEKP